MPGRVPSAKASDTVPEPGPACQWLGERVRRGVSEKSLGREKKFRIRLEIDLYAFNLV